MTWPAALPGAALRSLRTAAGRRALQVVLLVGGLFALGFLCGGQASAAEGVSTAATSATTSAEVASADPADGVRSLASGLVGQLVKPPAEPDAPHTAPPAEPDAPHTAPPAEPDVHDTAPPAEPRGVTNDVDTDAASKGGSLTDALDSLSGGTDEGTPAVLPPSVDDKVLRPVTEHVVGAVDGKVLQPVGDLVETVTGQLAEVQAELPLLPSLPRLPSLPAEPGLPELPELPTMPGLPAIPGQTLPVTTAPQPESPVVGSPEGDASGKRSGKEAATAVATAVFYGPPSVAGSPTTGTATRTDGHRAVQGAHAPVQQAPGGDTGGALGNRPTADSGSSRHGDAHAVSLNHRASVRLVVGAAARADAFDTRDRHRDIPVSPA